MSFAGKRTRLPRIANLRRGHRVATATFAAGLAVVGASCGSEPPRPRPSVILVTLDTTRADHFESYGFGWDTTPHFDALGQRGVRFENCLASAALTPVSHATILTGLEPYHHGLRVLLAEHGSVLPAEVATLAETLAAAGYDTAAFLSSYPVSERYGLDQGFARFDAGLLPEGQPLPPVDPRVGQNQGRTQRRSDLTTDRALAWLATAREPFFLWIHYWDPHDPNTVPPPAELERYAAAARAAGRPDPTLYASEIRFVDEQFGRVVAGLEAEQRLARTLVAVTADHGEGLGEHGWHAHRLLYQEQIHVPLLMAWPGGPRGASVDALVRTTDIVPTVLEVLDLPPPTRLDGRSLVGLAAGVVEPARTAYSENLALWDSKDHLAEQRPRDALLHAAVRKGWKLVFRPRDPEDTELYDLARDPDEAFDRSDERPDLVRELRATLEELRPFVLEPLGPTSDDAAASAALAELGYLGDDEAPPAADDH